LKYSQEWQIINDNWEDAMIRRSAFFIMLIFCGLSLMSCDTAGVSRMPDGRSRYASDGAVLPGKAAIEGYVIDAGTGKGIQNAKVEIKNANMGVGYYLRETGSEGYFKIEDFIPYVNYVVEISAAGYVTYVSTDTISEGKYKYKLMPEAILAGQVKNSRGEPLRGVEVKLKKVPESYRYSYLAKPYIAATDGSGSYQFAKLPGGSYLATFSCPDFITETAQLKYIKSGETFNLPMVMIRPATITGGVSIEGLNTPAINVNVTISGLVSYTATSFQDGTYRFDDIKPGNYKIIITHQGFYDLQSPVIRINEGDKKEQVNFTVKPKEPKLSLQAYRYTFAPGDTIQFNLRTFRMERVSVTIYRAPVDLLMKGGIDPDALIPEESGLKAVTSWDEPIKDFDPYEWRYQSLQVKAALPSGGYCIEARGAGKVINRKFFTLTTVGVVMKRSMGSIFAYATNLIDNSPIADARLAVFDPTEQIKKKQKKSAYKPPERIEDLPAKVVLHGTTNGDGIFHKKLKSDKLLSAIVTAKDGSYAICNTGSPASFQKEQKKYFIYTDRPVYRAGDTVYYKIIGKNRESRFVPLPGEKIYFKIINWDMQKTVTEGSLKLDEWGTADDKLVLSREVNLGTHEIRVGPTVKNLYSRGIFYVEQYRKPEFFIEITPSKDYFVNGDTAEFKIEAKYFFGAPLKGAFVKYRFYETKLRDSDTRYWWEEDYPDSGSYNRLILEGEKYVDNNGIAVLKLHAGNYPFDREITCEATVVDKSNISITSSNKVRVGRGEYYIKIEPVKHFFSSGEKKEIRVRTLTQTGKPYSAKVKVELYRYIWKPWERVYVHDRKPIFAEQLTTDKDGVSLLELPKKFNFYGEFDIVISGIDARDNIIFASRVIWIYSPEGAIAASRFKNLELSLSSTELKKPGEVTCLVKSCFTDAFVCLTLEGRDVYESKVIKMNNNIQAVAFNVKPEYAPNLFVTATMQRKRALYMVTEGISLPIRDTDLSISIETDKQKYKPGERARVTLKALDASARPIKADLSLAAVDESIYYIRYDHTPAMRDYFYSKISNWVLTSYSYPITLLAGAAKDGKVKVREKFEDTAFWTAKIRTDEKGVARVEFDLPDNLTTWRLTVRGHDMEGRVGEKKMTFLVTQDLIARIGKPRFLIEGDLLSLIGIVNSNTERGLNKVDTEFTADSETLAPEDAKSFSLSPFGSSRNYYPYKVPRGKSEVALQFTAKADRDAADALKIRVPVERRGVAYKVYGIGDMANNKRVSVAPIKDTDDFSFVPDSLTISVNPSPITQMLKATKFLSEYPYGCIEQTLNSFIPALALHRVLEHKGYVRFISDPAKRKLDDKVKAGILRVQQNQNDDGTWGWWSGSRGNANVTGYALYSLYVAKLAGYEVQEECVKKGLTALALYFKNPELADWDAIAYLMYINSIWGKWDHEVFKKIIKAKSPGIYQMAFTARALASAASNAKLNKDMKAEINKQLPPLIAGIINQVKKDGRGVYWESRDADRWGWPGGDVELTAHVLSALVEADEKSSLPAQIVRSLSNRARGNSWSSTKETATVIHALCGYIDAKGSEPEGKAEVSFKLNGKKAADFTYDPGSATALDNLVIKVPVSSDKPESAYVIEAEGKAGADMTFDVTIAGTLYFKDKGFSALFKSEEKSLQNLSNGIKITRTFAAINRVRDIHNNEYLVPQSLADKKVLQVGDELMVKVKFLAQDNFQYLVMEDYLPSGFEVIKLNAYDSYTPYVHIERWDNRMVYFFTDLKKNTMYEVAYIVRAELPGSFMARPARMECMYEPTIQGWSAPALVDVKKK
jgi:alpha-2-macroglobulin